MEEYLVEFKKKKRNINNKNNEKKFKINIKPLISKFLIAVIFFLGSIIFTNISDKNMLLYKEYVLTESMPFTKVKGLYEKLFGSVLPKGDKEKEVFGGNLVYKDIKDYLDGEELTLSKGTLVNSLASGIIVFIGEKEGYGNTVIVQGIDGVDIWYGNVTNVSNKLYDYIETNTLIGETSSESLYLVIKKDNEFIKYENYKN